MTPPPFSATTRGTLRSRRHRHDDAAGRCTLVASKSMGGGVPKAERCGGAIGPDGLCARHAALAELVATRAADLAAFGRGR